MVWPLPTTTMEVGIGRLLVSVNTGHSQLTTVYTANIMIKIDDDTEGHISCHVISSDGQVLEAQVSNPHYNTSFTDQASPRVQVPLYIFFLSVFNVKRLSCWRFWKTLLHVMDCIPWSRFPLARHPGLSPGVASLTHDHLSSPVAHYIVPGRRPRYLKRTLLDDVVGRLQRLKKALLFLCWKTTRGSCPRSDFR